MRPGARGPLCKTYCKGSPLNYNILQNNIKEITKKEKKHHIRCTKKKKKTTGRFGSALHFARQRFMSSSSAVAWFEKVVAMAATPVSSWGGYHLILGSRAGPHGVPRGKLTHPTPSSKKKQKHTPTHQEKRLGK